MEWRHLFEIVETAYESIKIEIIYLFIPLILETPFDHFHFIFFFLFPILLSMLISGA